MLPDPQLFYPTWTNWARIFGVVEPFLHSRRLPTKPRGYPADYIRIPIWQLFHMRHQKLLELRKHWLPAQDPLRQYCLPGFANYECKLNSCCLRYWCPFCWGREVVSNVFNKFHSVLYGKTDQANRKPEQYGLISSRQVYRLSKAVFTAKKALDWVRNGKSGVLRVANEVPNVGSTTLYTLEPEGDRWRIEVRGLTLVFPGKFADLLPTPGLNLSWCYYRPPVRKSCLAVVVGRSCSYPKGLLTEPAAEIAKTLAARRRSRLLTSYGLLRNEPTFVEADKSLGVEDDGNILAAENIS